ncbi:MAG: prepilin peptidase [Lachnospiraceae bacterium]|nr:prepilin peptidase [Lachnospiraceae bacterium]
MYLTFGTAAFLMTAAVFDLKYKRIPNVLTAAGLFTGLFIHLSKQGFYGFRSFICSALLPVVLLFLLFFIRALGAADIKVFSVISTTLPAKDTIAVMALSFLIGAVIALLRILKNRTYPQRARLLLSYAGTCIRERKLLPYETVAAEESYLSFTVCIFFAYLLFVSVR